MGCCYQRLEMSPTQSTSLLLSYSSSQSVDMIQRKMSPCFTSEQFPADIKEIADLFASIYFYFVATIAI
jgi:hypothetical protein